MASKASILRGCMLPNKKTQAACQGASKATRASKAESYGDCQQRTGTCHPRPRG